LSQIKWICRPLGTSRSIRSTPASGRGSRRRGDARIKQVEPENAELRRANEILKTASADRFGAESIRRVLCEHVVAIAPSARCARQVQPIPGAELADDFIANTRVDIWWGNQRTLSSSELNARNPGHR
jgi:hypothetical protein